MENNCVACSKDKKRGVPPKTRWKEEQKEKARSQEARGKENRAMAMSSPGEAAAAPVAESSEPQRVLKEVQKDTESSKGENTQTPVACVAGVPRGPVSTGEIVRVTPSGSSSESSRGILYEINQQYLRSKYKFKEGAPLKEYLRQRVPNLRDTCTLWEVLTWLKEIIRDNLLFDESNPAMIVGDAPLEAALRKKRVHMNEVRGVVQQQLTMVEASQGPLSARMLSGGTMYEGTAPGNPRPEARAATTQANTSNARVHVYVEWEGHRRMQDVTKRYVAPLGERELESMRLEWSYLRGRDDYMLRRDIQDAMTSGCWMKGMLMELRQLQAAGREGPGSMARHFGVGHLALRSGGTVYAARCRMVVVELRNPVRYP